MALVHQLLYEAENISEISLQKYIEELVLMNVSGNSIRTLLSIPDMVVQPEFAISIGMITNELVNNALKHAFAGKTRGELKVSISISENLFHLSVSDNGMGFPSAKEAVEKSSLGFQIIESLVDQLDGTWRVKNSGNGTEVLVSVPFSANR